MRRPFVAFAALLLAGCGQNPLLRSVSADYAPVKVGSQWSYKSPGGGSILSREVVSAGTVQGRQGFTLSSQVGTAPASFDDFSLSQGALERYDPVLGWVLERRLPYVKDNKWVLATGNPLVTAVQAVELIETVDTPAGRFNGCYRLKTSTSTYDPLADLTTTAESLVWAAPNVGDVRYATLSGSVITVTLELSSYRIPR